MKHGSPGEVLFLITFCCQATVDELYKACTDQDSVPLSSGKDSGSGMFSIL